MVLTFIIYLPALRNGFVNWDDNHYVYENSNLQTIDFKWFKGILTSRFYSNWHPLTMISYAVDYSFWGLNPLGYHLTNIVLHAIDTFLVFLLVHHLVDIGLGFQDLKTINATRFRTHVALIVALLFGIHPIHVESVAWVSERKDVLYAAFFLLTILCYLKYVSGGSKRRLFYGISLIFFILSLMSKPMAVSLPVVLLIFDYYPLKRSEAESTKKILIEKLPFLLIGIVCSIITVWAQGAGGALMTLERFPLLVRIAVAARAYLFYLIKMILPINLAPYYPYPTGTFFFSVEYLGSIVTMLIITYAAIRLFKKNKLFSAVWLYYIVTLIPVIGIVQIGAQAAADRYTYLPSLGPFVLIGVVVGELYERTSKKNRMAIIAALLIVSCLLMNKTIKQIGIWYDSITLWSHEIKIFPESAYVAYNNRGNIYFCSNNFTQAMNDFNKAIEINPWYADAYNNRGEAYNSVGKYAMAISDLNKTIELNPKNENAYTNRGEAYYNLGNYAQALKDVNKAIELNPQFVKAYNTRGITYANSGNYQKALNEFNMAIALDPEYADAYYNSGLVYQRLGNSEKALLYLNKAAELNRK